MFGRRKDGRSIRGIDPMVLITPYIMPRRDDAQVFIKVKLDFESMTEYIRKKRAEGHNITYMGMVIASYVRAVSQYPELNRFIMNKQLYARNHICTSFVILKKNPDNSVEDSVVKVEFEPEDTIFEVSEKIEAAIAKGRVPTDVNVTDVVARWLLSVPGLPLVVVGLLKFLDRYGLMPNIIHKASPFHTGFFVSNMASLGMSYIYHHIYNFGNTSLFASMGKSEQEVLANADGTCRTRRVMPVGVVVDERICAGGLFAQAFGYMSNCMHNPELLERRPEKVRYEIPHRKRKAGGAQANLLG